MTKTYARAAITACRMSLDQTGKGANATKSAGSQSLSCSLSGKGARIHGVMSIVHVPSVYVHDPAMPCHVTHFEGSRAYFNRPAGSWISQPRNVG